MVWLGNMLSTSRKRIKSSNSCMYFKARFKGSALITVGVVEMAAESVAFVVAAVLAKATMLLYSNIYIPCLTKCCTIFKKRRFFHSRSCTSSLTMAMAYCNKYTHIFTFSSSNVNATSMACSYNFMELYKSTAEWYLVCSPRGSKKTNVKHIIYYDT